MHFIHNIYIYLSACTLRKQAFLLHFESKRNVSRYSRTEKFLCFFFDFSRNLVGKDGSGLTLKNNSIRILVGKPNVLVEVSMVVPRPSRKIRKYY